MKILLGLLAADQRGRRPCSASTSRARARMLRQLRRLHARARLPAAGRRRPPISSSTWRACPACRATAARERTADMLRHVGLYEERYRPIGGYSTGMKQRVKLAQALVHDPQLLLPRRADERPRPGRPRRDARPDPPDRHRVRDRGPRRQPPARRDRADLRPRSSRSTPASCSAPPRPDFTERTGMLAIEVDERRRRRWPPRSRARRGLEARPTGRTVLRRPRRTSGRTTSSATRSPTSASALVRMEQRRHQRSEDLFQ